MDDGQKHLNSPAVVRQKVFALVDRLGGTGRLVALATSWAALRTKRVRDRFGGEFEVVRYASLEDLRSLLLTTRIESHLGVQGYSIGQTFAVAVDLEEESSHHQGSHMAVDLDGHIAIERLETWKLPTMPRSLSWL